MVTIKDVAKRANVSISTVSLTINNSDLIKNETKQRVFNVIDELGYKINFSARSLVTKRNMLIAAINLKMASHWSNAFSMDSLVDTYMLEMLKSISMELQKAGYSLLIEEMMLNDDGTFGAMPQVYNRNRIDGALFIGGMFSESLTEQIIASTVPTVLIGSRNDRIDWVDADHEQGIFRLVNHLAEKGHHDIAFINGPYISQASEKKTRGYRRALEKHGIPFREDHLVYTNFTGTDAYNAIKRMWEKGLRPTAVMAGADCMSLGILNYFYDIGLKCPDNVSITGYEHGILSAYSVPPLLTMSVNKHMLGVEGIKALLARIANPDGEITRQIIEPELIVGKSVAAG